MHLGFIKIDEGAYKAILNNKSLLPAGVIEVGGKFNRGDIISVYHPKKEKVAVGVSAYDINEARKIIGKKSRDISKILGYEGRDEIIHKDNLVKTI
jgi:Glutamate 5-kinase